MTESERKELAELADIAESGVDKDHLITRLRFLATDPAETRRQRIAEWKRKQREKNGATIHKILYCEECFCVFDRRVVGSNKCPKCDKPSNASAFQEFGGKAYRLIEN